MATTEKEVAGVLPEAEAKAIAAQVATIASDINAISPRFDAELAKRDEEIKRNGKATEETGARVDAIGGSLQKLQQDLDGLRAGIDEKLAQMAPSQGREIEPATSLGETFVGSDTYRRFKADPGNRRTDQNLIVPGYASSALGLGRRRAASPMVLSEQISGMKTTLATTAATRLIPPTRTDIVGAAVRPLSLWDLIPMYPYAGGGHEYVREVGFYGGDAITPDGAAWSGGYVTITDTAHGVREGAMVRIEAANPTSLNGFYRAEVLTANTFRIRVPVDPTLVSIGAYRLAQTHGAAAATAELSALPEATWQPELVQTPEGEIGHFLGISRQVRNDDAVLRAYIDERIPFGVEKAAERAMLYGTGVSPQWLGIMNVPRVGEWHWSRGATSPVADTKIDAIRRAIAVSAVAEYPVTGVALSVEDSTDIDLVKGTDGHYIYLRVVGDGTGNRFFALPRVEVHSMVPGTALVGAFALAAGAFLVDQAEVEITDSHSDWFQKRILGLRAFLRGVFEVSRPEAFTKVIFDGAPVAET